MPTYKNEATGSWYCAFYYTDWLGNRKKKKKEGLVWVSKVRFKRSEFSI